MEPYYSDEHCQLFVGAPVPRTALPEGGSMGGVCPITGCSEPKGRRSGLCGLHYDRWRRGCDMLAPKRRYSHWPETIARLDEWLGYGFPMAFLLDDLGINPRSAERALHRYGRRDLARLASAAAREAA